jgi:anti-sigma regulatory factor (Ser/Thr protein kinase)
MTDIVTAPAELTASSAATFLNVLHATTAPQVLLDYRPLTFATPVGIMLSAMGIRAWARQQRTTGRTFTTEFTPETSVGGYLNHIGYFAFIADGFSGLNRPGEPGHYLPLTRILREDVDPRDGESMQDRIEARSEALAQILCNADVHDEAVQQLRYCFRELIRNALEHANVETVYLIAQRFPKKNSAEIAIGDLGRGIHASLSVSRDLPTPEDAIRAALQPGVSRFTESNRGEYGNSGYGLYITSEFCRQAGRFHLATSGKLLTLTSENETFTDVPLTGTVVQVRLNTRNAKGWSNALDAIIARGEAIAAQNGGLSASSASKRARL